MGFVDAGRRVRRLSTPVDDDGSEEAGDSIGDGDFGSGPVDDEEARRAIEAVVMVAEEPVEPQLLAQLVELPVVQVEQICETLGAQYAAERRGFELVRVAGGYQYRSHPDQAAYIERFVLHGRSARLSAAALETLAIVAYKQPVSRAQIAAIRGVNVDGVVRTLERRGYITEIARDPGPGQAVLYGTTKLFLSKLGIDTTDDLPPLAGFIPDATVVEALESGLRVVDDGAVAHDSDAPEPTDVPGGVVESDDFDGQ